MNNLQAIVQAKHNELQQQKNVLTNQAKLRLDAEIQKTKYALEIAKAANIETPIQNLGESELFAFNLGSKAIDAKISALNKLNSLIVFEPRLQQIEAKLSLLKSTSVKGNMKFKSVRYLEEPEQAISRDKPKRSLIAVLGCLLGGMLGVAIVLIRFAFRKADD